MAKLHPVKQLLTDGSLIGTEITVNGWLRSKRDSKAGISFLAVNDGSHFDSLQCVAPKDLDNYESVVLKLSTGCAVCVKGQLVASRGSIVVSFVPIVAWSNCLSTKFLECNILS